MRARLRLRAKKRAEDRKNFPSCAKYTIENEKFGRIVHCKKSQNIVKCY